MSKIINGTLIFIMFNAVLFSQETYTIPGFSFGEKTFPQMETDVIVPDSGSELQEVNGVEQLKPGELLLRRKFGPTEYRLYKGKFVSNISIENLNLFSFEIPSGVSWQKALTLKWYKEKTVNPDLDESDIYFDSHRLYARMISKLFFMDGEWKSISSGNIEKQLSVIPTGDVYVSSIPPGGKIIVDGNDANKVTDNYINNLTEGTHTITVELADFQKAEEKVTVTSQDIKKVKFNLTSALGGIVVTGSPPGADVSINGVIVGKMPYDNKMLKPGKYIFEFSADLHKKFDTTIIISMNEVHSISIGLQPEFGTLKFPESMPSQPIIIDGSVQIDHKIQLRPGEHRISWNGGNQYVSIDTIVNVEIGRTIALQLNPVRLTGSIKVLPIPIDAEVFVDGQSIGTGAQIIKNVITGNHELSCYKQGYSKALTVVNITAGSVETVNFSLSKQTIPDSTPVVHDPTPDSSVLYKNTAVGIDSTSKTSYKNVLNQDQRSVSKMDTCFKEDSKNRLGLKIGTNFSRLTGAYWKYIANEYANQILERTVLDIKGMPGLYGSIFYNYTINNNFGVQVEITGQTNGTAVEAGIDSPGVKTTLDKYQLHFAYVTIPILLQPAYHFNKSISVHLNIGVEAEILARAVKIYESSKSSKTNIKNLSSKYNAGYIAGIEGVYCTSKGAEFSTEIRYEGCLFTVFKNDYPKAHRQMITINFGYTIKKI